jgi:hypothetical protein
MHFLVDDCLSRSKSVSIFFKQIHQMTTFKLTEELQNQISEEVREWSLAHGLLMGGKVAPVTLLPTKYPKKLFRQAEELALPFNRLTHLVAYDRKFMNETMK